MRSKTFALLLAVLMCVAGLCGCGEKPPQTIEDFAMEHPGTIKDIESSIDKAVMKDIDVTMTIEDNCITLTSTLKDSIDSDEAKEIANQFEANAKKLGKNCNTAIDNIKEATQLEEVTIKMIFNNGDGKEMWSHAYDGSEKKEKSE